MAIGRPLRRHTLGIPESWSFVHSSGKCARSSCAASLPTLRTFFHVSLEFLQINSVPILTAIAVLTETEESNFPFLAIVAERIRWNEEERRVCEFQARPWISVGGKDRAASPC